MKIPVQINEDSAEPLYRQVENQLRSLIIGGKLQEGTLLPSIREFAADLKCSVITIRRVYQDLENEGWLRTRQGTGTFVTKVEQGQLTQMSEENVRKILNEAIQKSTALGWDEQQLQQLFAELIHQHFTT
ncbi:GntR family transcriptional regulator [Paenibacillus sp. PK4536]|uniref:HTH-type transcriptional repressor YtrA n=1 Tax=Paenibacillus nuruki TaxID=1886670 RepID=A0A1E3KZI0_9BACL|nr:MULTISPECIES: GntR family transcriptional regulator [Paenibacillus]ODP26325.1 HTH-type transcriptional repressor YtrA [Paenibacillus nuruki]TKJ88312.1 GntR family transcriptional regulator [Paenibacillus sp. CFBP13512]WIM40800.1 GntR family transcriptional regulator [Paenibacillus sp. PK4536]CAJ1316846.1 HTH-type transcriptional repressor YtrA [Paenibacillus nuruki]